MKKCAAGEILSRPKPNPINDIYFYHPESKVVSRVSKKIPGTNYINGAPYIHIIIHIAIFIFE